MEQPKQMEQQRQIHIDTVIYEINQRMMILRETIYAREKEIEQLKAQLPKNETAPDKDNSK